MNKLFSAALFALSAMCATSAAANPVQGGHLYIQDVSENVIFTYGDAKNQSYAWDNITVYVGTIDANGNFVDQWKLLFWSVGHTNDIATLGSLNGYPSDLDRVPGDPYSFIYTPNVDAGAVELVFKWTDQTTKKTFYSYTNTTQTQVTYYSDNRAMLGLEDANQSGPWDWNDVLIRMTNVSGTVPIPPPPIPPPVVPEPETYAMMLAGLAMIGAVARRRRKGL